MLLCVYGRLRMYVACGSILTVSAVSEPVTCTYEIRLLLPEVRKRYYCGYVELPQVPAHPNVRRPVVSILP